MKKTMLVIVLLFFGIYASLSTQKTSSFGCKKANEYVTEMKIHVRFSGVIAIVDTSGSEPFTWVRKINDTYHLYKVYPKSYSDLQTGIEKVVVSDTTTRKMYFQ